MQSTLNKPNTAIGNYRNCKMCPYVSKHRTCIILYILSAFTVYQMSWIYWEAGICDGFLNGALKASRS